MANTPIIFDSGISADTISEKTAGSGVTIDGILLKDNVITGDATGVKIKGGDGTAVPAGMVGEKIEAKIHPWSNAASTTTAKRLVTITLNKGVYIISANVGIYNNNATALNFWGIINTTDASLIGFLDGDNGFIIFPNLTSTGQTTISIPIMHIVVSADNTPYYLNVAVNYSAGTPQLTGRLTAIRIG